MLGIGITSRIIHKRSRLYYVATMQANESVPNNYEYHYVTHDFKQLVECSRKTDQLLDIANNDATLEKYLRVALAQGKNGI